MESGREDAFVPGRRLSRVGDEARKLARQRPLGTGRLQQWHPPPRRYLWDETPVVLGRFSQMNSKTQREPLATAFPLMNLMNDDGNRSLRCRRTERLPGLFSRSTAAAP